MAAAIDLPKDITDQKIWATHSGFEAANALIKLRDVPADVTDGGAKP
ncbi:MULTISPECIES: hypothetical protein [unclassified Chelatococcus]|nr:MULTISPECIES: hypothetical protein [unclassified Chelatococcus]MBS7696644.1 hypothetical protein [Chelatococcus sp. YT9]MBX3555209.1 hypothetical protein [Chelatococcus sp.]